MTHEPGAPRSRTPGTPATDRDTPDTAGVPSQRTDEYAHLDPVLARYVVEPADSGLRPSLWTELTTGYAPLARNLATRYRGRREPLDDLVQVAMIGLLNALARFDPHTGTPFVAFAIPTITGELRHHLRDRTWATRVPRPVKELQPRLVRAQETLTRELGRAPRITELAHALQIGRDDVIDALQAMDSATTTSLDRVLGDGGTDTVAGLIGGPDAGYAAVEARQSLIPALRLLSDRERTIITLRFFGGRTQTEIAAHLGLSQMQVSRLLASTLARLRRHLDDTGEPARSTTA